MRKTGFKLLALLMVIPLLFSGCLPILPWLSGARRNTTAFDDMPYTRPELSQMEEALEDCLQTAQGSDWDALLEAITDFNGQYSNFSTQYMLAYIHYCLDMTDTTWETEYHFCADQTAQVELLRDDLLHALADSPHREQLETEEYFGEDFFTDYEGESIWTETFTALMEQEDELVNEYYELSSQTAGETLDSEPYTRMEEILLQLVALRQQIAREAGYDNYVQFAYDQSYFREFTPEDTQAYIEEIRQYLAPQYRQLALSGFWEQSYSYCSERKTRRYVANMAENMGGIVEEAFEYMEEYDLYDISYSENKFQTSFETYLYDYDCPYVFVSPSRTIHDQLTFAHEFGHFCNDYASGGDTPGTDVSEVFSQGMEYLSLCYADDADKLRQLKMADSLCIYVEQAAYTSFEHQLYGLSESELTVEAVRSLFDETMAQYGLDCWDTDSRSYVLVSHFFIQPIYVISYVVSNDAAMQLYQMEQEVSGSGLLVYTDSLSTEQEYFLAYLKENGLDSPFDRVSQVSRTFADVLNLDAGVKEEGLL